MTRRMTIPHPATGEPVTMCQLGKEYGIHHRTIRSRWDADKRGMALVEPPNPKLVEARMRREEGRRLAKITAEHELRLARQKFLMSPAGRLTVAPRLGDYGRMRA